MSWVLKVRALTKTCHGLERREVKKHTGCSAEDLRTVNASHLVRKNVWVGIGGGRRTPLPAARRLIVRVCYGNWIRERTGATGIGCSRPARDEPLATATQSEEKAKRQFDRGDVWGNNIYVDAFLSQIKTAGCH